MPGRSGDFLIPALCLASSLISLDSGAVIGVRLISRRGSRDACVDCESFFATWQLLPGYRVVSQGSGDQSAHFRSREQAPAETRYLDVRRRCRLIGTLGVVTSAALGLACTSSFADEGGI